MSRQSKRPRRTRSLLKRLLRKRQLSTHRRLGLESLETRQMLAAAQISFEQSTGQISIVGTNLDDAISISPIGDTEISVAATTGSETVRQNFATRDVTQIVFTARDGDDVFLNGTSLPSTVFGGLGNDTLRGGEGIDQLVGDEGNDRLYGNSGDDRLTGGSGDDRLEGGEGNDWLAGGQGLDVLVGHAGNDTIYGDEDADLIYGGDGDDDISAGSGADTVNGGNGDDLIKGDSGDNQIFAEAGRDVVLGGTGHERIEGGDGNDLLYGGAGNDLIYGQAGDDLIRGQAGNDVIHGNEGNDELTGEGGNDIIDGGEGDDYVRGYEGDDRLYGMDGDDFLIGDEGDDRIEGGNDNDLIYGNGGHDALYGGAGNDTIRGQAGNDLIYGDAGHDSITAGAGADIIDGGDGDDYIRGEEDDDRIYGQAGNDVLIGDGGDDRIEGGDGNDLIYGKGGNDVLIGEAGNDTLRGQEGNDLIYGSAGDDVLSGEDGIDSIYGGSGADQLYGNGGEDRLFGELGDDQLWGGADADRLEGGEGNDTIFGEAGDDTILGENGSDVLHGQDGNDALFGGDGEDQLIGGEGNDTLWGQFGMDFLRGNAGDDSLFGQEGYDVLYGDNGNDRLEGGEDSDFLRGDLGNDILVGGDANDFLLGSEGDDSLYGGLGDDYLDGGADNDLLDTGEGDDVGIGRAGIDRLLGDLGNDILLGGEGEDRLEGNDGQDLLIGGMDSDTLSGQAGEDILIGAWTSYDSDVSALRSLRAMWTNQQFAYGDRVAMMSHYDPQSSPLAFKVLATVFDDGVQNYIYGGADSDWMILASHNSTYDPLGMGVGMHGHGGNHAAGVVLDPLLVEGFALIDAIDQIGDAASTEVVASVLPHGADPAKAAEHVQLFQLIRYADVTHMATQSGRWSDPAIWQDGQVPTTGARVLIPIGIDVEVDSIISNEIETIRVDGHLSFAPAVDTELRVDTMVVTHAGSFQMGTSDAPIDPAHTARLTFTDNGPIDRGWDPFGMSRGLISHGSVKIYGAEKTSFLEVAGSLVAGSRFITLSEVPTNWRVGDSVVIAGTSSTNNQDEERTILSISGSRIEVAPLSFAHVAPETNMAFHVANTTRNVVFESEGSRASRLGHVMFMHNRDVQVNYAGFYRLGRTDKSVLLNDPEVDSNWRLVPGTGTNPRARYAVHFHRNGATLSGTPSVVHGSVATDNPGWGFVNHSSYVDITDSVAYDILGAGFVTETGEEVGTFQGNIAIHLTGSGAGVEDRRFADDFGHSGEGFWLQSPGTEVIDNVVAGSAAGAFTYYMLGLREFNGVATDFASSNLADPSIAGGRSSVPLAEVPLANFSNNTAYASATGLVTFYVLRSSTHGMQSILSDSLFWNNQVGVHAPYGRDLVLDNLYFYHDASTMPAIGFSRNSLTQNLTLLNTSIVGYQVGVEVPRSGTTDIRGGVFANVVNFAFGPALGEREFIISPETQLLDYAWQQA